MTTPRLALLLAGLLVGLPACGDDGSEPGGASGGDAAADTGGGGGGLGCTCAANGDCTAGFCSDLKVCTTSDQVECEADSACDCGARCVVVGATKSCQIPCATNSDCPGQLQCAPLTPPWTTTSGDTVVSGCVAPTGGGTVTWEKDIQPLVANKCAQCHLGGNVSGGVHFDTYADTQVTVTNCPQGSAPRVVAHLMAEKVSPTPPCGNRMPLVGGPLSDAEVKLFADWVAAGTPEK